MLLLISMNMNNLNKNNNNIKWLLSSAEDCNNFSFFLHTKLLFSVGQGIVYYNKQIIHAKHLICICTICWIMVLWRKRKLWNLPFQSLWPLLFYKNLGSLLVCILVHPVRTYKVRKTGNSYTPCRKCCVKKEPILYGYYYMFQVIVLGI